MWNIKLIDLWNSDELKAKNCEAWSKKLDLIASMPITSTAQSLGNENCTSNIYTSILSGEFVIVNFHLL